MIPSLAVLKRAATVCPPDTRRNLRASVETARLLAPFAPPGPIAVRVGLAPRLRVLTYPDQPSKYQAFHKLCAVNGFRIVTDPQEPHDLAIHFQYQAAPCTLPPATPTINRDCGDVSKRAVERAFAEVFGYDLSVDPISFTGDMVEKPDGNHTFDGRIVTGPLPEAEVRPGFSYQRMVDTREPEGTAVDLRVPVYGGQIPVVYEKRRPADGGLKDVRSAVMRDPAEVFGAPERERIVAFAQRMGLDYGEMDILRDRHDGRIYVVDVNNTPAGPPKQMTDPEIAKALGILSPAFRALMYGALERERTGKTAK